MLEKKLNWKVLVAGGLFVIVATVVFLLVKNGMERGTGGLPDGIHESFHISCIDTGTTKSIDMGTNESGVSTEVTYFVFECDANQPGSGESFMLNLDINHAATVFSSWQFCAKKGMDLEADIEINSNDFDRVLDPMICVNETKNNSDG